ncbi:TMEM143 family protein [Humisphaera borealis]|uniref:DUF3754 domain-containing protein n=1 Tax=Humisphaera borealis TaxID=2807512 RepID=A0A7M2WW57_9BACT|nr:TMEM143 family protein [Humisphaera borealis]QOV88730.1 DUF3754 domain-containing protein [Humisphaera borealis]
MPTKKDTAQATPTKVPREHFIPIRRVDLLQKACDQISESAANELRKVEEMLVSTLHFEYHRELERLKIAYGPFDPDADTRKVTALDAERKDELLDELVARLSALMCRANFTKLTRADLESAMQQASHWGINLSVDFDLFDRLEVYYRGEQTRLKRTPRRWFGLRKGIKVPVELYTRLVVLLRIKTGELVPEDVDTNTVHIKAFKDIPKLDLEMLLPGTRVNMSLFDRIKLGFSLSTGIGMTGYKMAGPLVGLIAGATSTSAMIGIATGAVGYSVRSFYGYMQTKQKYMLTLAQNLYFLNLDNNAGVFFRILDEAEEQECRETLLSYYLLAHHAPAGGWTVDELDAAAEAWLKQHFGIDVDFEADDAVAKLKRFQLLACNESDRLVAASPMEALRRMDKVWDEQFDYNQKTESPCPEPTSPR